MANFVMVLKCFRGAPVRGQNYGSSAPAPFLSGPVADSRLTIYRSEGALLEADEKEFHTDSKPRVGRSMSDYQRVLEGDDPLLAEVVGAVTDGLFAT